MAKRNITIQLDEHDIEKVKVLAVRRGTSVSAMLARQIEDLTDAAARYEEAQRRAIEALDDASNRGGRTWRREDLYDRDVVG